MKHILAWLTLLFTATFVAAPFITSPFSGFRADQLPMPQVDPPIQPAGYAFSIWGLIYGWLLISALFGLWKRRDAAAWDRVRAPLALSLALGTPWLAVANASAVWATVLIFLMAITAIAAILRAPRTDRWLLQAPVALYSGWLTAASFVSLGSTAAGYGMAFGPLGWAYAGIIGALVVALAVLTIRRDTPGYGISVVWALIGIIVANQTAEIGVSLLAGIGAMLVAGVMFKDMRRT
jgi:hypothetical protein